MKFSAEQKEYIAQAFDIASKGNIIQTPNLHQSTQASIDEIKEVISHVTGPFYNSICELQIGLRKILNFINTGDENTPINKENFNHISKKPLQNRRPNASIRLNLRD